MDARTLSMFKRELVWNCWVAQGAWGRLREMKRRKKIPGVVVGAGSIVNRDPILEWSTNSWSQAHALLGSTATISRILWPPTGARAAVRSRAKDLLAALNLPSLPELEGRSVRNAYEHSENDAPEWFEKALIRFPGRPLMGWAIGDGSPVGPKKVLPQECFRYLDNVQWTLRVGDEAPLDLKGLMVAVELLGRSIEIDQHFDLGVPP
jgi:hypothetical protein